MTNNLADLLKKRFADRNTAKFDPLDFLYAEGSALDALWYSELFWPRFTEIDGNVFLADTTETKGFRQRLESVLERNPEKVERSFNTFYLEDLFDARGRDLPHDQCRALLNRLAEMWRCRLHAGFPNRAFQVQVIEDDNDIGIVFYQQP